MAQALEAIGPASGMVAARKAIEKALVGPTSGGNARLLAPIVLSAIICGQIPGVRFTPFTVKKGRESLAVEGGQ